MALVTKKNRQTAQSMTDTGAALDTKGAVNNSRISGVVTAAGGGTTAAGNNSGSLMQTMANLVKSQQQTAAKQNPAQTAQAAQPAAGSGYNGLQGLSAGTAQQIANSQNYAASQAVNDAMAALQSIQNQKPQGYESKYSATLDSIMQQITNPQDFKYSFNGDALFQAYKDMYTQQGKQASLDAMGQAAGLTGGYGNSYGQQVGQQTYQQWLTNLYDKGMDTYDRAYQRWKDQQNGLYDQYNLVANADNTDYGRYRDTVGDWQNERNYYTDLYNTESDRDYSRYADVRDYWTGLGQAENQDYWTGKNFDETVRQWDEQFNYTKMTDDRKYAFDICTAILANGQMPSSAQLKAAGLSQADAKKMQAQAKSGGGRGGSSKGGQYAQGPDGNFYKFVNGKWQQVDYDSIPQNASIDTQPARIGGQVDVITTGMGNVVKSATDPAIEQYKKMLGIK